MTKRLAIAFFYDEEGIVDEYMIHLVKSFQPFVDTTVFVSNGSLTKGSESSVSKVVDRIIIRENKGFDVWAYKTAIEAVGYEKLADFDELLLYNHTFYGPIFPFSEMFEVMESRDCDFWGITMHKEMAENPFKPGTPLRRHINSHFIAVRKPMLTSLAFKHYWDSMEDINSYDESVIKHESRFTHHFIRLNYRVSVYQDPDKYGSPYPSFIDIEESIKDRLPILKRRLFFHDPVFHDAWAIILPNVLRRIEEHSTYDLSLVWKNIARTTQPRILNTNASLMSVFPDVPIFSPVPDRVSLRVAVCAHVFYVELLDEILGYSDNIPESFDLIATTDTEGKRNEIERIASKYPKIRKTTVLVVEQNRGRDMASLLITCRDIILSGDYDLICRLHTKKTPQVPATQGIVFKNHLLKNLLHSKGYVSNVLEMFQSNPAIGIAMPPIIHIGFTTLGHAWFANKPRVIELMKQLDLTIPLDEDTPVAAYGSMFWFRPAALRKIFLHKFRWEEFPLEGQYGDGDLPHALERIFVYVAQDAGYTAQHIITTDDASINYTMLEYKIQKVLALSPRNFFYAHIDSLKGQTKGISSQTLQIREASRALRFAIKRSLLHRSSFLFYAMRPFYRAARRLARAGRN
ncbi:hypothetical protein NKJ26_02735 [Mesorhizobium sp. M0152]|uniref:rhamnan synthesis F family protein n=1 Tax=Mesorhizobium TaxID=68287 RepID=UPI00333D869D